MMRSVESASSVFYHSQEEESAKTGISNQGSHREAPSWASCVSHQDSLTDSSPVTAEQDTMGKSWML